MAAAEGNRKKKKIMLGVLALVVVVAIAVTLGIVLTRPENIELTKSEATETLPSLIKAAMIEGSEAAIVIEFTEQLTDKSILNYYLDIEGGDTASILNATNLVNPTLYLLRPNKLGGDLLYEVGSLNEIDFPHALSNDVSFLPGDFEAITLLDTESQQSFPFKVIDERRNIATPTTAMPTISPMPTMVGATRAPTAKPTTFSPTKTPLPNTLISTLGGKSRYNIAGTITIDYAMDFKDGNIVDRVRLRFDVSAISAPGPFLYLSKRPFSETENRDITDDDIFIQIEGVNQGSFTKDGMFEQVLEGVDDVREFAEEYNGGSFIIWCRPFGVWLGGGQISVAST